MLLKETLLVRALGFRIPMLLFLGPRVLRLDDEGCDVLIPLGLRSRNHVGVMYVGALCAGADLASGLNALRPIRQRHRRVVPLFKDLQADFLKRADGDVVFRCDQGRAVAEAVAEADRSGERVTVPVDVVARVPAKHGDEPVARFTMGLTLKRKG